MLIDDTTFCTRTILDDKKKVYELYYLFARVTVFITSSFNNKNQMNIGNLNDELRKGRQIMSHHYVTLS